MDIPSSLPLNPAQLEPLRKPLARPAEPSAAEQSPTSPDAEATAPTAKTDNTDSDTAQALLGADFWAPVNGPKHLTTVPAPDIGATTSAADVTQRTEFVIVAFK